MPILAPDDDEILRRIAAEDGSAERLLLSKYAGLVLRVARAKGLPEEDAKEVANDVFLEAIEQARRGHLHGDLGPWLRTVTRHRATDRFRRNRTIGERDSAVVEELGQDRRHADNPHETPQSGQLYPFRRVAVRMALREMEEREQQRGSRASDVGDVQILQWVAHGVTIEELAAYLGQNTNAARQRKFRALRRLKETLDEFLEE